MWSDLQFHWSLMLEHSYGLMTVRDHWSVCKQGSVYTRSSRIDGNEPQPRNLWEHHLMSEIPRGGTAFESYIRLMPGDRYRVQVPGFRAKTFATITEAREYRDKQLGERRRKTAAEARKAQRKSRESANQRRRSGAPLFRDKAVEWLAQRWHDVEVGDLKRSTVNHNSTMLYTYVLPKFGHLSLDEIRVGTVEDFRRELETEGARKGGGLGVAGTRHALMVVGQVFDYCIRREEWVGMNPVTPAKKPKKRTVRVTNPEFGEPGKLKFLTMEQAETLVGFLEQTQHHLLNLVRFNLYMGLRPGELFPLEWRHVDIDAGRVNVRLFLDESAPGKRDVVCEYGKTSTSYRTIPFPESLRTILKDHRERQESGESLVFPSPRNRGGRMYQANSLNNQLRRACERAGIPRITPYGLRHTNATFMLLRNMNPKVAAERLGHASTQMFLDTYSHVNPRVHEEGALVLQDLI